MSDSFADLMAAARRGDRLARDELCRRFEPDLRRFVTRLLPRDTRRWVESGDIVQQVLFEALRQLDDVAGEVGEEEMLRRMKQLCRWRMRDAWRDNRRLEGMSRVPPGEEPQREREASLGPVTRSDELRWLRELVARLPEHHREAVRLCALEGLSFVEAGAVLGITPDAVRKRYEAARKALARRLSGRKDS